MPAPAGTDAGTASQLIRGVGRTWAGFARPTQPEELRPSGRTSEGCVDNRLAIGAVSTA